MRIFSKPRQVAQDPRRGNVEAGEPVLRISAPLPRQIHDEDAVALGIGYFRPMLPTDPKSPLLNIKVTRQAIWVLNADNTLTYDISYSGLGGDFTASHIHGPAAEGDVESVPAEQVHHGHEDEQDRRLASDFHHHHLERDRLAGAAVADEDAVRDQGHARVFVNNGPAKG